MTRLSFSVWLAGLVLALGSVLGCGASPTEAPGGVDSVPKSADAPDPNAKGGLPTKAPKPADQKQTDETGEKGPAIGGAPGTPDTVSELKELNVGVGTPPSGWEPHDTTRTKVGPPYVMSYKRGKPEAHALFGTYEPFKGRAPLPGEMRDHLRLPFSKLFDVTTLREEPAPDTKWLGEAVGPNHGMKFRAQSSDGLIWVGEAYAVAHKGIAYYWLNWCPENDFGKLKDEFASFRGKFKFLDLRDDWKETRPDVIDYKSDKGAYMISAAEELWKEVPVAPYKELDPDLDKLLRARIPSKLNRKAPPDEAELRVYRLDGGGDPLQVARKLAKDRETARIKDAGDFTLTFKELSLPGDPPRGDPVPPTVPATAPVVRLLSDVKESKDAGRLIVASGLTVGKKTVVVVCSCEARARDRFETRFIQIVSSLR